MKKLYNEERDTDDYDNLVMKHMMAMTTEGLHSKAAISIELAYRDWQIEQLRGALEGAAIFVESHCNDESPEGWPAIKALLKIRNALEETK